MGTISRQDGGVVWRNGHHLLKVVPYGPNGVRIQATMSGGFTDQPHALLLPGRSRALVRISAADGSATLRNGNVGVHVNAKGCLSVENLLTQRKVLDEPVWSADMFANREFAPVGGGRWRLEQRFVAHADERFYGMGQHQHGWLDQKGCVIPLEHRNTEISIPFLLSNLGYGFLWNFPGTGRAEITRNGTRWVADAGGHIDYYVTVGRTPADILRQFTAVVGRAPAFPEWASGFWQCKLRYKTQAELLAVAREHNKRGLPMSVIVIDYYHWTKMGDWKFDSREWPDPAGMVHELKQMGIELMVSVWPTVNSQSENFRDMQAKGLLAMAARGTSAQLGFMDKDCVAPVNWHWYDALNPAARTFVWNKVRQNYHRHGARHFWLDACEPELKPPHQDNIRYVLGTGVEVGGLYPLCHAQAFYEGQRVAGQRDILNLARSAWVGSQRYGAAVWSGDIESSFKALRNQVPAGLNMGLSGIPWWTTDIGGFHGGNIDDPAFRELLIRWFQYGVFCPIFRLHGQRRRNAATEFGDAPNEVWSFGARAYQIIRDLLFLRERLRPYVHQHMRAASRSGAPLMRPLFWDFPDDAAGWPVEDQFMFGPDIMVAPVLHQGLRQREVYLPAGATWQDAWTGKRFKGGAGIKVRAPLDRIPVLLREGQQAVLFKSRLGMRPHLANDAGSERIAP